MTSASCPLWSQISRMHCNRLVKSQKLRYSATSSQRTEEPATDTRPTLEIPTRVHREPTSILRALADTVNYDPTFTSGMPLIDDPDMHQPSRHFAKMFVLSEASGKGVAEHMASTFSQYLQHDKSAPTVEAFTPKTLLTGDTEEALKERLDLDMVKDARSIYSNMIAEGKSISPEIKLQYLDALCRFNSKDEDYYKTMPEKYFFSEEQDHWRPIPEVTELFEELRSTHPQAYISMICGMCSYKNHREAHDLYLQGQEEGILFPIDVHNHILSGLVGLFSNIETIKEEVEKILVYLENNGIRPNLQTFNNILCQLKLLPPYTDRYSYSLKLLSEMRCCHIDPSPATYYHLLQMVYRTQHPRYSDLLSYTVDELSKQKPILVQDAEDNKYFLMAMAAARQTNDVDLAKRLYKLAWRGCNKALLGSELERYRFHNYYLLTLIASEPIDTIMEAYNDLVPRVYIPESKSWKALYEAIELYDGYQYVPQIYQDLKFYNSLPHNNQSTLLSKLLAPKHAKPEILQLLAEVADDMYNLSLSDLSPHNVNIMTADVYSNFIQLALNMDDVDKAYDWFMKYRSANHMKRNLEKSTSLVQLAEKLFTSEKYEETLTVLQALADLNFQEDITKITEKCSFPEDYKERVELLNPNSAQDSSRKNFRRQNTDL